jgi:protein-S-isoprenylcysteine O-methyltransferase Ste14
LACLVYATIPSFWLLIHSRAEYWRAQRRSPYRILVPVWMGTWIVMGLATNAWRQVPLYHTVWSWLPAVALFLVGIWLYQKGGVNFSKQQLYGLPELKLQNAEQRLVTSGIRARVRHPVYLGHLCEMLAWSIGTGLAVCFALTAFAVITGAVMIRAEDSELQQRFGDEYRCYRESVPAVLPRVGHA